MVCIQPLLYDRSRRASRAHRLSRLSGRFRDRNNFIMGHACRVVKHGKDDTYAQDIRCKQRIISTYPHCFQQPKSFMWMKFNCLFDSLSNRVLTLGNMRVEIFTGRRGPTISRASTYGPNVSSVTRATLGIASLRIAEASGLSGFHGSVRATREARSLGGGTGQIPNCR